MLSIRHKAQKVNKLTLAHLLQKQFKIHFPIRLRPLVGAQEVRQRGATGAVQERAWSGRASGAEL